MASNNSDQTEKGLVSFECSDTKFNKSWLEDLVTGLKSHFSIIQESITDLKESLGSEIKNINQTLVNELKTVSKTVNETKQTADKNALAIEELRAEMVTLKKEVHILKDENVFLKNKSNQIESYSRRDNLLFYGIVEKKQETNEMCEMAVRTFFKNQLKISDVEINLIKFVRCHRLRANKGGAVRPIIVRFCEYVDREKIWRCLNELPKKTAYYMSEDFPAQVAYNRRKLLPIFSRARKSLQKNKVQLKSDTLIIDGQKYTVDTICNLDGNLHPRSLSRRSNNSTEVAGGIFSIYDPLSNFGKFKVNHEGREFTTLEHGFVYYKCLDAKDEFAANKVLDVPEPHMAKRIGDNLKNLNITEWNKKRDTIMKALLRSKFARGTDMAKELLATGNRKLGEAGRDSFYGTGLPITHPDTLDSDKWFGQNRLGKMQMEIRSELRQ